MKKSEEQRTMTINDAMNHALALWKGNNSNEAAKICQAILAVRAQHQGAKHLLMTIMHGVTGIFFTAIGHHDATRCWIGDFSYGFPTVMFHNQIDEPAPLEIGKYCTIAHDVNIYLGCYHRHDTFTIFPFSAPQLGTLFNATKHIKDFSSTRGGVRIGNDVWIGAHSVVLAGVTIGDGAIIGAGSVVTRDVGAYQVWAGNPAAFRRRRFNEQISERLLRLRWWDLPKEIVEQYAREIMSSSDEALTLLESVKLSLVPKATETYQWQLGYSSMLRIKKSSNWLEDRVTWVVLHGSLGSIEAVAHIESFLPEVNLLFIDLPGCGSSTPPADVSVAGFAQEIAPIIDAMKLASYHILGVSFGGSVGLQIAQQDQQCQSVVLLDTPFTAKKLWHNHAFLRNTIAKNPDNQYIRQFAYHIYGVTEEAAVERDYWYLLDAVNVPITVLTGDIDMQPIRAMPPIPCCLDEDDLNKLTRLGVNVIRVSGGHDLIHDNVDAVVGVISKF